MSYNARSFSLRGAQLALSNKITLGVTSGNDLRITNGLQNLSLDLFATTTAIATASALQYAAINAVSSRIALLDTSGSSELASTISSQQTTLASLSQYLSNTFAVTETRLSSLEFHVSVNHTTNRLSSLEYVIERSGTDDLHIGDKITGDIYIGYSNEGTSVQRIYIGGLTDTVVIGGQTVAISATTLAVSNPYFTVNTSGTTGIGAGMHVFVDNDPEAATFTLNNDGDWAAKGIDGNTIVLRTLSNALEFHQTQLDGIAASLMDFQTVVSNGLDSLSVGISSLSQEISNVRANVDAMSNGITSISTAVYDTQLLLSNLSDRTSLSFDAVSAASMYQFVMITSLSASLSAISERVTSLETALSAVETMSVTHWTTLGGLSVDLQNVQSDLSTISHTTRLGFLDVKNTSHFQWCQLTNISTLVMRSAELLAEVTGVDVQDVDRGNEGAMFDLARVVTAYDGPVVYVRRGGDNEFADVYADLSGNLTIEDHVTPLSTWLGPASAHVVVWYDQYGSGRDATQYTPSLQPMLKISSAPVVDFSGIKYMNLPDGTVPPGDSAFTVVAKLGTLGDSAYTRPAILGVGGMYDASGNFVGTVSSNVFAVYAPTPTDAYTVLDNALSISVGTRASLSAGDVLVYTRTSTQITGAINGSVVTSVSAGGSSAASREPYGVFIGRALDTAETYERLNGELRSLYIFNRALTVADLSSKADGGYEFVPTSTVTLKQVWETMTSATLTDLHNGLKAVSSAVSANTLDIASISSAVSANTLDIASISFQLDGALLQTSLDIQNLSFHVYQNSIDIGQLSYTQDSRLSSLEFILERNGDDLRIGDKVGGDIYIGYGTEGTSAQRIFLGGLTDTVVIGGQTVTVSATTLAISNPYFTVNAGGITGDGAVVSTQDALLTLSSFANDTQSALFNVSSTLVSITEELSSVRAVNLALSNECANLYQMMSDAAFFTQMSLVALTDSLQEQSGVITSLSEQVTSQYNQFATVTSEFAFQISSLTQAISFDASNNVYLAQSAPNVYIGGDMLSQTINIGTSVDTVFVNGAVNIQNVGIENLSVSALSAAAGYFDMLSGSNIQFTCASISGAYVENLSVGVFNMSTLAIYALSLEALRVSNMSVVSFQANDVWADTIRVEQLSAQQALLKTTLAETLTCQTGNFALLQGVNTRTRTLQVTETLLNAMDMDLSSLAMSAIRQNGYIVFGTIMIQWGFIVDQTPQSATFSPPFSAVPFCAFAQRNIVEGAGSTAAGTTVVTTLTATSIGIDSVYGSTDKATVYWIAIGLA